ncbi:MAG: hypothetical protein N2Z68_02760 [Patescibacteria group bacterium]|nr:hypothetical protein [Patescibacteria group bacterium]
MRNYSKVGNRVGKPAYRTPAYFRLLQNFKVRKLKVRFLEGRNFKKKKSS